MNKFGRLCLWPQAVANLPSWILYTSMLPEILNIINVLRKRIHREPTPGLQIAYQAGEKFGANLLLKQLPWHGNSIPLHVAATDSKRQVPNDA